jgi:acyl carrier protein
MSAELSSRVRSIVSATFGIAVSQITEATGSETLEAWDSMHQLHLLVALETEFDVSFEPEMAVALTSVGAIEDALRELVAHRAR